LGTPSKRFQRKSSRSGFRVGVRPEDVDHRPDVEVVYQHVVGDPVEQRRAAVFEEGSHLRLDGPEDEEAAADPIGGAGELIDDGLKMGGEVEQHLAIEVLELIERHDVARLDERADGVREPERRVGDGDRGGHGCRRSRARRRRPTALPTAPSPGSARRTSDQRAHRGPAG
jgi:hypothetical protein